MPAEPHAPTGGRYPDRFVAEVLDRMLADGGRIQAVAGLQGTGKSTLCRQLEALGAARGLSVVSMSIDDFYLGHDARARLGREVHPLCAVRGVPGTHEVPLACRVLDALREGRATAIPRFDKIGDDRLPGAQWRRVQQSDLAILEGWFLEVPPQAEAELVEPLNALERDEDPDGTWRRWSNDALGRLYPALWQRLDRLLFLQGPGFGIVPRWRWQQEQTLQAEHPGRQAMTQPQVERFVQFFERVSRQALRTLPAIAARTVRLDADRTVLDTEG